MTMKPPVPPARSPRSDPGSRAPRRPASAPPPRAGASTDSAEDPARSGAVVVAVRRIFAAETGNYFLLLGTTLFLVAFGLIMVLSSSSIESYLQNDSDFFASFSRQGLYALIGIPLMLVASRMPAIFWKKWAWAFLVAGLVLQLLVFIPGIGWGYGGNQNWIKIAGFTAQPSELVKIALIVWIAWILSTKAPLLDNWRHVLLPIGPVAIVAIGFVLIGNDLGTAVIMLAIVFGSLYFAGVKLRYLITAGILISAVGLVFAFGSESRTERINSWLNGCTDYDNRWCWQPIHGTWALASGGIFGVGLGNSKAKWSWLPEADNDYIFAIVGEELGLIGAIVVLALFIVLAFAFVRIIRATDDRFAKVATSGVMVWIVGQALVNIGVVLGALPVLGVPLPLISAGGSALISTLLAIGVVLSFARKPVRYEDEPYPANSYVSGAREESVRNSRADFDRPAASSTATNRIRKIR